MIRTLLLTIILAFTFTSNAADIQSAVLSHHGNPVLNSQIKINVKFTLKNGKKRYTTDMVNDYIFDKYWTWYKVKVTSPQAYVSNGILRLKRAEVLANRNKVDLFLSVRHSGKTFRDTFHIDIPKMKWYEWQTDSIRPYQWNPLTLRTVFEGSDTMKIKELPTVSLIQYDDFSFMDSSYLTYDNGFVYYEPRTDTFMNELAIHSVNIAYQVSSFDTFNIVKQNQLALYLLGDDGLSGYHGRNGENGSSGEHGGHGEDGGDGLDGYSALNAEFILSSDTGGYVLMMYVDSTVTWYQLGENAIVDILALGGNGGEGGHGGRGGRGGSSTDEYEAGDDGNGGNGGDGGNGGFGGNITVITDLDMKMVSRIISVNVEGGKGGQGGVRGYGERSGKDGSDGEDGKSGIVTYIKMPSNELKVILNSYK